MLSHAFFLPRMVLPPVRQLIGKYFMARLPLIWSRTDTYLEIEIVP
jgi:hypothetical protein